MISFKLSEAAAAVGGRAHPKNSDILINRLFTNSREACGGNGLFFAICGERVDGHDFVPGVVAEGNAAFVDNELAFTTNTVLVDDVKQAIYRLADWYRKTKCPEVKAVCITGSVGKTTTKDMTGLIFSLCSKAYVTGGNKNSLIGLPLSVMAIDADDEYAVLELGMSERGEIEKLSRLARPHLSMITTIGSSHLQALGSIDNIKNEKFDILKGEHPQGKIILNADNELERIEGQKLGNRAVFCSSERPDADYFAEGICETVSGISFNVVYGGVRTHIELNVAGRHNVNNALLAFAAGICCGFDAENCAEALSRYVPAGNRQHKYEKNGITVIADCYNASPESMAASLAVLTSAEGRKIAVLGDMMELGADSTRLHREVAVKAVKAADIVMFVGDMSEVYSDAVGGQALTFGAEEKKSAAKKLTELLRNGDTVLFKASNRLHLEDIIKEAGL